MNPYSFRISNNLPVSTSFSAHKSHLTLFHSLVNAWLDYFIHYPTYC